MESTNRVLDRIPIRAILWAWPLARIFMCVVVYLLFSETSQQSIFAQPMKLQFYAWFGWTITTTLFAVVGQSTQPKLLWIIVAGDVFLTFAAIILLRGAEGATIAFAVCIGVIAVNIRLAGKWVIGGCAIAVVAFLLRDVSLQGGVSFVPLTLDASGIYVILQTALLLLMTFMLGIWGNRKSRLDQFDNAFASLRTLSFEKSFQFDLQIWTDACASLFSPRKAACLISASARGGTLRYYHSNLPSWNNERDREEIIAGLRGLPFCCTLVDVEHNRIIIAGTGTIRSLNEHEQKIARLLHRANIKAALIQPMQIDHAHGGIICALPSPIDPITVSEACFIEQHITEMTAYLGKIATAQRDFIADAHDVARRDLHDGVLQTLAALRMRLLLMTKRKDVAKNPVELEIRKAVDIVTLEQSRLRGFLENNEAADHTVNLVSQIDICVRTISLQWGIDVKLKSDEPAIPVDTETSFNIEHLLREVVTNAVRHANSKSLTVTLSLKQDALMMAVTDLGQPLEGAQLIEKSALTLKSASLRDRLRLVNGEAYAEGLGKGTLLSIRIPMQQIEND